MKYIKKLMTFESKSDEFDIFKKLKISRGDLDDVLVELIDLGYKVDYEIKFLTKTGHHAVKFISEIQKLQL